MIQYVLKYSLDNRFPVTIIYQKGLEINQRRIQVIKIESGTILAYCYYKKGIRSFKKESILSAQIPETSVLLKLKPRLLSENHCYMAGQRNGCETEH